MGIINKIKFAILPVIGLPILFAIGSKNYYRTIAVFISIIVLLMYARLSITSRNSQSKFFLSWTISSVIYLWILSVLTTIQTDDGLQREHYALASITFGAMLFFRLAKRKAKRRTSVIGGDELQGVTCYTRHAMCSECHRSFISSGPSICTDCQPLMGQWKHYSVWLSCYITERNHLFLLLGHTFAAAAFLFGAGLMIITACQPNYSVILERLEMNLTAPVDCSQVYTAPEILWVNFMAVNFMGAIYAFLLFFYCTIVLIHQICQLFVEKIRIELCRSTFY